MTDYSMGEIDYRIEEAKEQANGEWIEAFMDDGYVVMCPDQIKEFINTLLSEEFRDGQERQMG